MQRTGLGTGNHECSRSGRLGGFELGPLGRTQRCRRHLHGVMRLRVRPLVEPASENADPQTRRVRGRNGVLDDALRAGRIRCIRPLHRIIGKRQVVNAAGEGSHVIEAVDKGIGAAAGQASVGGFQSKHAAKRGRHPDRSCWNPIPS